MRAVWAFGAVLLASGAVQAQDAPRSNGSVPSLVVEGEASRDVAPDTAVITVGVTSTRTTAKDAAQDTSRVAQALIATAKASGIADADIATVEATLSPVYDQPKNGAPPRVRGFQADNGLSIRLHDPMKAGELAGQLLDQGANDLKSIEFAVSNPDAVLDDLRAEAARNAQHRAMISAHALGLKLGRVLLIRPDASAVPYARANLDAPAPAMAKAVPLATGSQRLRASVSITWALDEEQP
jgi:uncharacterized protein